MVNSKERISTGSVGRQLLSEEAAKCSSRGQSEEAAKCSTRGQANIWVRLYSGHRDLEVQHLKVQHASREENMPSNLYIPVKDSVGIWSSDG